MFVALLTWGCQPDCRLVCEKIEEADCANGSEAPDCEKSCKHQEDLVTNAECQEDYDAYLLCVDQLEDVCDIFLGVCDPGESCPDPKCDNELEDLNDCFLDYCEDHPRNNECEAGV